MQNVEILGFLMSKGRNFFRSSPKRSYIFLELVVCWFSLFSNENFLFLISFPLAYILSTTTHRRMEDFSPTKKNWGKRRWKEICEKCISEKSKNFNPAEVSLYSYFSLVGFRTEIETNSSGLFWTMWKYKNH